MNETILSEILRYFSLNNAKVYACLIVPSCKVDFNYLFLVVMILLGIH